MGIRSLEHYIQQVDDLEIKRRFQGMQQGIKLDAQKTAEKTCGCPKAKNCGTTSPTFSRHKEQCIHALLFYPSHHDSMFPR